MFPDCSMQNGSLDVRINANSVDMSNPLFESVLKGKAWFNTEQFPYIHYTSDNVEINEDSLVSGTLTVRDISQPVTVDVSYENFAELKKDESIKFKGTTQFNRLDFDMTSFQSIVGKDVQVAVSGEFLQQVNMCL